MVKGHLGKLILGLIGFLGTGILFAQAPQSINYQAVARNSETGEELINQTIFIAAKILTGGPQGQIVYQENHNEVVTNAFGLFSLQIGEGNVVTGQFGQIPWSQGNVWLEIDLDIGNGLETVGSMQFVSVPYALYAESVANVDDADADPNNEKISGTNFSEGTGILTISEAGQNHEVDLTYLKNDADANPQNEVITSLQYDPLTSVVTINEAGNVNQLTLNVPIDDADHDPENELINPSGGLILSGTTLEITEGGIQHDVQLSSLVDDADADPGNELISTTDGLVLSGTTLEITEAGIQHGVNLSSLIDDADADPENELIDTTNGLVLSGTTLEITEGGIQHNLDLASLVDDADADPENELIDTNNGLVLTGSTLEITEGGVQHDVDLSSLIDDDDADSENELINPINGLVLDGDTMLQVTEGGVLNELDLTPLIDDGDWIKNETTNVVYNTTDKIGIGTNNPTSNFEVNGSVAYNVTVMNISGPDYTIQPDDHIIVCKCNNSNSKTLTLPDAQSYPGREIRVRRLGPTFVGCSVIIDGDGSQIDYLSQSITLNSYFGPQGITLISVGSQGWVTLNND